MRYKTLDEKTLKGLISNLRKFAQANGAITPILYEHSEIIDTIVDGLYHNDKSFIDLFFDKSFSRKALELEVIKQINTIVSQKQTVDLKSLQDSINNFLSQKHPLKTTYIVFPLNINFSRVTNFPKNIKYKTNSIEILNYHGFKKSKYYPANIKTELENRFNPPESMYTNYYFFWFNKMIMVKK